MSFEKFLKTLKKSVFSPIVIVIGEDEYYYKEIENILKKTFSNLSILKGSEISVYDLKTELESVDIFSEDKVFFVSESEKLKNAEVLEDIFLMRDRLRNKLILYSLSSDFLKKIKKKPFKLLKSDEIFHFKRLYERNIETIISEKVKKEGKSIEKEALALFISSYESNLVILLNELEKLLIFVGDSEKITIDDIKNFSGNFASYSIFDLVDAFRMKKKELFFSILGFLLKNSNSNLEALQYLSLIYGEIKKLLLLKQNAGKTPEELGRLVGIHPYLLKIKKYTYYASQFSEDTAIKLLEKLADADIMLKHSKSPEIVFSELLADYWE